MAPGWDERHAYMETVARPVTARLIDRLDGRPVPYEGEADGVELPAVSLVAPAER
jgi:hypothetical protein